MTTLQKNNCAKRYILSDIDRYTLENAQVTLVFHLVLADGSGKQSLKCVGKNPRPAQAKLSEVGTRAKDGSYPERNVKCCVRKGNL